MSGSKEGSMTNINEELDPRQCNVQNEILLVGCFYKNPDLYIKQGQFVRSKYDFSDEACKFYYDNFELMYKTFSQTVDEFKVNTFMSQDSDRFKLYNKYGKFTTIKTWMNMADINDVDNYFDTVKKYSLVREYVRNGYPVQKMIEHPKFPSKTAEDVYKLMKAKADKISTVILCNKESITLNSGNTETVRNYLISPQMGLPTPWRVINEMFRGCRLGKVIFDGLLSNEGKTRKLTLLACYITMVMGEKFLLVTNEMDEEDLRSCMITTVLNNPYFKEIHGIQRMKPEREIVLGIYRDDNGNILQREKDEITGEWIETEEEWVKRVEESSSEYRDVQAVARWVDETRDTQLFFKDVGQDYSDQALEFEFKKHNLIYGVKYAGYDTLKGFGTDDWQTVKQTGTRLKELMKEIGMFLYAVFQMTDDSVFVDIFDLSSNNIANAKQIKHIADHMTMGKRLNKEEYIKKYRYLPVETWGEAEPLMLDQNKTYYGIKCEKNRGGAKTIFPLYEVNLDYNTWNNIGTLIKAKS